MLYFIEGVLSIPVLHYPKTAITFVMYDLVPLSEFLGFWLAAALPIWTALYSIVKYAILKVILFIIFW